MEKNLVGGEVTRYPQREGELKGSLGRGEPLRPSNPDLVKIVFTLYRISFAPARKPHRIGLLFTLKNGDFGAISVTEGSCAATLSIEERHISDRFCTTLWYNVNGYSDRSGSGLIGARRK